MKSILMTIAIILLSGLASVFGQTRPNIPVTGVPNQPFTSLREVMLSKTRGWDVGISIGSAHSLADIGGTRDASRILFLDAQWKATGLHYGAFARYRFSDLFALNVGVNYGQIGGADSLSPETSSRYDRAYYFENDIYELALKTEFYLPKRYLNIPIDVYAYTGIIAFYHDPRLSGREGPIEITDDFSLLQPAIPFGVGFHYTTQGNFKIGFNVAWRKTFTDYLDGEAPATGPNNDAYFFNAINLGYYFSPRIRR